MMCKECRFAIWEEGVVVGCKKDLPEPEWNEEEECYECEGHEDRSFWEEAEMVAEERGDRMYHEMRENGLL